MTDDTTPRRFHLQRDADVTGMSGTGHVADGVLWPDGTASIRWRGTRPSIVHWDRLDDAETVHGHGGATRIVWDDPEPVGRAEDRLQPSLISQLQRYADAILGAILPFHPVEEGFHRYLSTGCLHGEHGYCQGTAGRAGAKAPAQCKFCTARCVYGCHTKKS
ncbi:hypothetical protein ACH4OW_26180 [Streptomyces sp. NPDC017056]|uniref:hypothetical protein n=1 Tax=Streptomyces sp. NPDC017056 TaxID=3364973 RepID=UPI003788DAA6